MKIKVVSLKTIGPFVLKNGNKPTVKFLRDEMMTTSFSLFRDSMQFNARNYEDSLQRYLHKEVGYPRCLNSGIDPSNRSSHTPGIHVVRATFVNLTFANEGKVKVNKLNVFWDRGLIFRFHSELIYSFD